MRVNYRTIAVCLALVVLAGCTGTAADASNTPEAHGEGVDGTVSRLAFEEDATVCQVYEWGEPGGIDCYPVNVTTGDDFYSDSPSVSGTIVETGTDKVEFGHGTVTRVSYPEDGRVCYTYEWGEPGGIDCVAMPDER